MNREKHRNNLKSDRRKRFLTVDVPKFTNELNGRNGEKVEILEKVKDVAQNPAKGFLLVSGSCGIGKTSLLAKVFGDEDNAKFFSKDCKINVLVWMNCSSWTLERPFNNEAKRDFTLYAIRLARQAACDQTASFFSFANIVTFFERQQKVKLFFVFDNVISPGLIDFIRESAPKLSASAVIEFEDLENFKVNQKDSPFRANTFFVKPLPIDTIAPMLEGELRGKIGEPKLAVLSRVCQGLPLLAKLILARFRFQVIGSYRSLCENIFKLGEHPTCDIMIDSFLGAMDDDDLTKFCAFLFFDGEESISVIDLAIIWSCRNLEEAEENCVKFEKMGIVSRLKPHFQETTHRFSLHSTIFRFATSRKSERLNRFVADMSVLSDGALLFALKMTPQLILDPTLDATRSLLKIMDKTIHQDRTFLWENLIKSKYVAMLTYEKYPDLLRLKDSKKQSALTVASRIGNFDTVAFVYAKKPKEISVADRKLGQVPLMWAISHNAPLAVVQFLHENYLDAIKMTDSFFKQTPLSMAVEFCDLDTVKFVWKQYQNAVRLPDIIGRLPLCIAAELGRADVLQFLYEKYPESIKVADKIYNKTPLHWASENGHFDAAHFLSWKFPRAVRMFDNDRMCPIDCAARNGHPLVATLLASIDLDE